MVMIAWLLLSRAAGVTAQDADAPPRADVPPASVLSPSTSTNATTSAAADLSRAAAADAAEPVHRQVDRLIAAAADGPLAERTTDAEFLRRATLDLAGRIPTVDELRAFLDDARPDKRALCIDRLLAAPAFDRRLRDALDVMLMERLGSRPEWSAFLETSFRDRRPWDEIVRTILDPPADAPASRGAAHFWTKRLENYGQNPVDYPALTRDVGRLFLGVDLQCAQCHDHLFVDAYKQVDYQGLSAFVGHTFIRKDVDWPAVGEKPLTARIDFTSVLTADSGVTGPRLPGGKEVAIPDFPKGEEFELPPDKPTKFPGRPRFRPLAELARQATSPDNPAFARNSVNRFWFLLFGRGLVHPLDLHHPGNPPSHPEVMNLLAREFVAHGWDIRWLLRELMLTEAYQRSSRLPAAEGQSGGTAVGEASCRAALERPLSAEQLLASLVVAAGRRPLLPAVLDEPPAADRLPEFQQHLERFRANFANPPRDPEVEFRPSVRGALFLMHDPSTLSWFQPADENETLSRLAALPEAELPQELYLAVLSRFPDETETRELQALLADCPEPADRARRLGHLLWALAASAEFALNH